MHIYFVHKAPNHVKASLGEGGKMSELTQATACIDQPIYLSPAEQS